MSDISIRLDGLLLGMVILAGAAIFAAVALAAAVRVSLASPAGKRSWKTTAHSLWLVLAHAVALVLLIAYVDGAGAAPTGPDWIDWLAIPWACFILFGMVWLVLRSRSRHKEGPGAG